MSADTRFIEAMKMSDSINACSCCWRRWSQSIEVQASINRRNELCAGLHKIVVFTVAVVAVSFTTNTNNYNFSLPLERNTLRTRRVKRKHKKKKSRQEDGKKRRKINSSFASFHKRFITNQRTGAFMLANFLFDISTVAFVALCCIRARLCICLCSKLVFVSFIKWIFLH